jgi:hypothetical protein
MWSRREVEPHRKTDGPYHGVKLRHQLGNTLMMAER